MRLIDADELMEKINNGVYTTDMTTTLAVNMACRWIENAPTVENVAIKHRCTECKHFINRKTRNSGAVWGICERSEQDLFHYQFHNQKHLRPDRFQECKRFERSEE